MCASLVWVNHRKVAQVLRVRVCAGLEGVRDWKQRSREFPKACRTAKPWPVRGPGALKARLEVIQQREEDAIAESIDRSDGLAVVEVDEGPGLEPGDMMVLASAIPKLKNLCCMHLETTGLGLRVDRWHREAYSLHAQGSPDFPRDEHGREIKEVIDLPNINFGPTDLIVLTRWMEKPEVLATVTSINLSGNPVIGQSWRPDEHIISFIPFLEVLSESKVLRELRLANSGMGFEAAMSLAQLFQHGAHTRSFHALMLLDVTCNPLGEQAKKELAAAVSGRTPALTVLDEGEDVTHLPSHDLDGMPGAGASAGAAVLQMYVCKRRSAIRAGAEMDSEDTGLVLEEGTVVAAQEAKTNDSGVVRVRFAAGWVSLADQDGVTFLEEAPLGTEPTWGLAAPPEAGPQPEPEPEAEPDDGWSRTYAGEHHPGSAPESDAHRAQRALLRQSRSGSAW